MDNFSLLTSQRLVKRLKNGIAIVARREDMREQQWCPLFKADLTIAIVESPICQKQRLALSHGYYVISQQERLTTQC